MNERVQRLQRLHALRCRAAEAAIAERRRSTQELERTAQGIRDLHVGMSASPELEGSTSLWRERHAELQVAAVRSRELQLRRGNLQTALEQSRFAEQEAVQAREQMTRMLQRIQDADAVAASRREQALLDDLFATALVRRAMATAF